MYLRTRLTLWFLLILGVVLATFGYAIYQILHDNLLDSANREVRHLAGVIAADAQPAPGSTGLRIPALDVFAEADSFLQVVDTDGHVLASSGNLGTRTIPLDAASRDRGAIYERRLGTVPLRIFVQPVKVGSQVRGYVVAASSPRTIYDAMGRLRDVLYPGVAITLLLGALVVWLVVRRAMGSLERLAVEAAAIATARDHTRRVQPRGTRDEIRRLTETINTMLAALEAAYRQVQETNDLQRQFLADISHELRTPLTIMLSSLDVMSKVGASDPEFQAQTLADMRVEADRMARMITQLLILVRTDSSAAAAHQPLLVGDVLAGVFRPTLPAGNGPALAVHGLEQLEGAVVWGNGDYLTQLFLILLDNARKYTPAAGRIDVQATLQQGAVVVTVADTGCGIAPTDLGRIFDRFYRAENARSLPGLGLGLAIARRIAEHHGGTITVTSAPGEGSRFTVTLPLVDQDQQPERAEPVPSPAVSQTPARQWQPAR